MKKVTPLLILPWTALHLWTHVASLPLIRDEPKKPSRPIPAMPRIDNVKGQAISSPKGSYFNTSTSNATGVAQTNGTTMSAYDLDSRTSGSFVGLLPAVNQRNNTKCSVNLSVECFDKNNRLNTCANMPSVRSTSAQGCFRGVLFVYNITSTCRDSTCSPRAKVQQLVVVRDGIVGLTIDASQLQDKIFGPQNPVTITEQVIMDFCLQRPIVTRSAVYAVTKDVQPTASCMTENTHIFGTSNWERLQTPLASLQKQKKKKTKTV